MRKPLRIALILAGIAAFLVAGFFVFMALCAVDVITFTKKTQTVQLPGGRILNIYRTSKLEEYECTFDLRERSGKVLIPRTQFYLTMYWGAKSAAGESSPETRTTFVPLAGTNSSVVGLVNSEDRDILRLLVDCTSLQHVAEPVGLSELDQTLSARLLSDLKRDYPGRTLALEGTEEAVKLRRNRPGLEKAR
jgi:hypothetical protein